MSNKRFCGGKRIKINTPLQKTLEWEPKLEQVLERNITVLCKIRSMEIQRLKFLINPWEPAHLALGLLTELNKTEALVQVLRENLGRAHGILNRRSKMIVILCLFLNWII
jgi:hypothetical protein